MTNKLIHQSLIKVFPIPPIKINLEFLKEINEILIKANEAAIKLEVSEINKSNFSSADEYEKHIKLIKESSQIIVRISEANGIFSVYRGEGNIFENIKLPNKIEKISIDSSDQYQAIFNRVPKNYFKIEFDFKKVSILDFSSSPSLKTSNDSYITISGEDGSWPAGLFSNLKQKVEEADRTSVFFHKNNTYDLILWLIVVPLIIFCMHKIDVGFLNKIKDLNGFIKSGIYIYIFIAALWMFRIFFNYLRWLYPYLELDNPKDNPKRQRIFMWILFSGFVVNIIYRLGAKFIFHI